MGTPTPAQKEMLEGWGVILPPTYEACFSICNFIEEGHPAAEKTIEGRILRVRGHQEKLV